MTRRAWTVGVSIATHAVVIGLLAASAPAREAPLRPESALTVAIVDPVIDVVMLAPDPAPARMVVASAAASAARASSQAVHAGHAGSTGAELGRPVGKPSPGPTATARPGGKSMLHMRYGPEYVSSLEGLLDHAVDMPPGTPPPQLVPSGLLVDDGRGTKRGQGGEFDAKVARDGSVKITDGDNLRFGSRGGPPVATDGSPVAMSFDITDAMMRRHGQDPYASAKLKFLDRTRPERVEMGLAFRKDQLAHAAPLMRANIARAFVMFTDPVKQRRALFELWDDCAETGTEELVEAGAVGRALVLGTIRARFATGSPEAYTASEIAAFARGQTSKAVFAPYD